MQTQNETNIFSVRNGAILGGLATAVGYLLFIIWTVVNNAHAMDSRPIIASGVLGCLLGLAVLGLNVWLERNARLIAMGLLGFVLLLYELPAASRLEMLGNTAYAFGLNNAALGLGFALAVFTIACLLARRDAPDNNAVRYVLLGLGTTGALLYLVIILNALAEGQRDLRLGAMFASGNVIVVVCTSLVLFALIGIFVTGLIAGTRPVAVKAACQWGIALGVLVFYFIIGSIFLDFFIALMKSPERTAELILSLILNLVTGIGTLFGPAFICIASLGRGIGLLSNWQQWNLIQQPSTEKTANSPTDVENQLKTLKDLHGQGLISQQEYVQKREEIMQRL